MSSIQIDRSIFGKTFWILISTGLIISFITYRFFIDWKLWLAVEWVIGVFLCLGFILPKLHNRKIRINRAKQYKAAEQDKWGFHSRDRKGPWLNFITEPLIFHDERTKGMVFYSEWLIIKNGLIIVNPGHSTINSDGNVCYEFASNTTYAWDGCSPKIWFYWFALFGTPDWGHCTNIYHTFDFNSKRGVGFKTVEVFWQKAHLASLLHDALYQYLDSIPLSKSEVDIIFYEMLIDIGFSIPTAKVYYLFVTTFGGKGLQELDPIEKRHSSNLEDIVSQLDHKVFYKEIPV